MKSLGQVTTALNKLNKLIPNENEVIVREDKSETSDNFVVEVMSDLESSDDSIKKRIGRSA